MSVLSNGFAFSLIWNVLENGYLDPHAMTRIDFHKERGKVRIMKAEPFSGVSEKVLTQKCSEKYLIHSKSGNNYEIQRQL